jgi:hypothetical protein
MFSGMKGMEMIAGTVVLEDTTINFNVDEDSLVYVSVTQLGKGNEVHHESYTCELPDFTKALAIAVHVDGMPNFSEDYTAAERAMRGIRWIP